MAALGKGTALRIESSSQLVVRAVCGRAGVGKVPTITSVQRLPLMLSAKGINVVVVPLPLSIGFIK